MLKYKCNKRLSLCSLFLFLFSAYTQAAILKIDFTSKVEYLQEIYHDGVSIQTKDTSIYNAHPTTISLGDIFTFYAIIDTDTPSNNFKPCCGGDKYYDFFNAIKQWSFNVGGFTIGNNSANSILYMQDGGSNPYRPDAVGSVEWQMDNNFDYVLDWKMQNRVDDVLRSYAYIPESLTTDMFNEFFSSARLYENLGTELVTGVSFGALNSSATIQNLSIVSVPSVSLITLTMLLLLLFKRRQ